MLVRVRLKEEEEVGFWRWRRHGGRGCVRVRESRVVRVVGSFARIAAWSCGGGLMEFGVLMSGLR